MGAQKNFENWIKIHLHKRCFYFHIFFFVCFEKGFQWDVEALLGVAGPKAEV